MKTLILFMALISATAWASGPDDHTTELVGGSTRILNPAVDRFLLGCQTYTQSDGSLFTSAALKLSGLGYESEEVTLTQFGLKNCDAVTGAQKDPIKLNIYVYKETPIDWNGDPSGPSYFSCTFSASLSSGAVLWSWYWTPNDVTACGG